MATKLLICPGCNTSFYKEVKYINQNIKRGCIPVCSRQCNYIARSKRGKVTISCKECNKVVVKRVSAMSKNNFCSQSCSARYNNKNKKVGSRRSKLEIYIENQLSKIYPQLSIQYNNKKIIGSELDIYLPALRLAFELNGIYHYEPIHGIDKLQSIQTNDINKFQKCQELGISLCIINCSSMKHFKKLTADIFLNIIKNIIDGTPPRN